MLACAAVSAVFATGAGAGINVGFADDATKYSDDGGAALFDKLQDLGAAENRIAVFWDPSQPATIQERAFLDRMLPVAEQHGIRVVFSVYPRSPLTFSTDTAARIAQFADYLKLLARTYPQVKTYVVLNEPNEAYFWAPQHDAQGSIVSAATVFRVLAAAYDALKSVDPGITVAGLGISPAANDRTSTSPVRFLNALGQAYRASSRKAPIMDELDLHIYPDDNAHHDNTTHYLWPQIGPADLDRIKQAVWDAFAGTAQPVFAEPGGPAGPALGLRIGEIGWQVGVLPSLAADYISTENVSVTDEDRQARIYGAVVRTLGCDPNVTAIDFFHVIDDRDLVHYQSGLLRADGSARPSYRAVRDAIAQPCGKVAPWTHVTTVVGASASGSTGPSPSDLKLSLIAGEDASVTVAILRVGGPVTPAQAERALAGREKGITVVGSGRTTLRGGYRQPVQFNGGLSAGTYVLVVRMTAAMNAQRTSTLVSAPFRIGS
jgi:hypothetical protein